MFDSNETCPGCNKDVSKKSEEWVGFRLMAAHDSLMQETVDFMTQDHVERKVRHRKEQMRIHLHRKCLADHIWMVDRYAKGITNFTDIEIETMMRDDKMKYHMSYTNEGTWGFKKYLEGGKEPKFNMDLYNFFTSVTNRKNMGFVTYSRDGRDSPLILTPKDDPVMTCDPSIREYGEYFDKAKAKFNEEYKMDRAVEADAESVLNTMISFAFNCAARVPA